jgi:hypothetical protein
VSPLVFVFGGIAVAGLGVFATFGTLGENQKNAFEKSCAPHCTPDDVSSVRTKLIIGDVGLFTALAAVGAGTTVFFVERRRSPPPVALRLQVVPAPAGGGMLAARGTF